MSQKTDVLAGVSAGFARFFGDADQSRLVENTDKFLSIADIQRQAFDQALIFVENKKQWHPRGVRLFAEIITIGILSRWLLEEKPLTDAEIIRMTGEIELIGNCWFHIGLPMRQA